MKKYKVRKIKLNKKASTQEHFPPTPMPINIGQDYKVLIDPDWDDNMEMCAEHAMRTFSSDEMDDILTTAENRTVEDLKKIVLGFISDSPEFNALCKSLNEYKYNMEIDCLFDCLFQRADVMPMNEEDMLYTYNRRECTVNTLLAMTGCDGLD